VRGRPRLSLGLACRARWEDAVEKAWLEWAQGTVFAGTPSPAPLDAPDDCADFDAHARWYTAHPEQWNGLPLWNGPRTGPPPDAEITGRPDSELAHLGAALADAGIEVFFRELTTVDAACVGLRVVRALAPQLVPIHGHHRWPHLGGTAADLAWRYPGLGAASHFPNPAPHPLG
jgi:ribosomal protein S12 methylthiotransferase accessory factor